MLRAAGPAIRIFTFPGGHHHMWGVARGAVQVGQAIGTETALERGHAIGTGNMVIWKEVTQCRVKFRS